MGYLLSNFFWIYLLISSVRFTILKARMGHGISLGTHVMKNSEFGEPHALYSSEHLPVSGSTQYDLIYWIVTPIDFLQINLSLKMLTRRAGLGSILKQ